MAEKDFDERLRDAEVVGQVVQSNIKNISSDISELKNMFSQMMKDSVKIGELQARMQIVISLERRVEELSTALANLSQKVVSVKSTHDVCLLGRTEEGAILKELNTKIHSIETNYGAILIELSAITKSRGRVESIFWKWLERIGWIVMISMFWILLSHSNYFTDLIQKNTDSAVVQKTDPIKNNLYKQTPKKYKLPSDKIAP